jgi:probable FeS assembly SUF system protein SufT
MLRARYEEVDLTRDCDMVAVPQGDTVRVDAGTTVVIVQALGDSYTVQVPTLGGLYRIAGHDADALGKLPPAGDDLPAAPVDEAAVRAALREVYDPEIPVNIVDLGLIYDLAIDPLPDARSRVRVRMTLTAPGCGMGQIIADDIKGRLQRLPGVAEAEVEVVWEPPWSAQRITPAARAKLGLE